MPDNIGSWDEKSVSLRQKNNAQTWLFNKKY